MFASYLIHVLILVLIFLIVAMSLNLVLGYTGLINLGHIALYGIGAYTSAILTTVHRVPFTIALLVSGLTASLCGLLLTSITRKLKGDYFALATLGFSFIVYSLMQNWTSLTRGPLGIPGIPRPKILGWSIATNGEYLLFLVGLVIIVALFLFLLTTSRYGKVLAAVRDDTLGAEALGKNTFRLKLQSMMIAAFIAGLAGSLYAHYINFIDPSTFVLSDLVVVITIVIVGGLASLRGSIIAAFLIILLPEILRFIHFPVSLLGPMRQILYATLLLAILMYRPRGLFGRVDLM